MQLAEQPGWEVNIARLCGGAQVAVHERLHVAGRPEPSFRVGRMLLGRERVGRRDIFQLPGWKAATKPQDCQGALPLLASGSL